MSNISRSRKSRRTAGPTGGRRDQSASIDAQASSAESGSATPGIEPPGSATLGIETAGSATPVSALEAHLGYWLRFVSNHVSHAFKVKVERHGVTVAEWVVLRALFDRERIKPSELSDKIGLTRGAVSKLLDRLANKRLVVIRGDAHDGRAQVIALSATGRALVPKLAAAADQNDAEAFGHLSSAHRSELLATLKGIVDRLGLSETPID